MEVANRLPLAESRSKIVAILLCRMQQEREFVVGNGADIEAHGHWLVKLEATGAQINDERCIHNGAFRQR